MHNRWSGRAWFAGALWLAACGGGLDAPRASSAEPLPWRTIIETRALTHDRLLPFLEAARPQVVQIGNYGAMFHGYADDPRSTGWPMQLPVVGERAALAHQKQLNADVHRLGLKVVGHFRLTKVVGNWKQRSGFVEYYRDRWPEDLLGPRPHQDLVELLQRDAAGVPLQLGRSGQDQLALCLSSPPAREVFRRMLKVAVDQGIDGVMTTYNYRMSCACPHCQTAFKAWLRRELTPEEIVAKLGVSDLETHRFESLPAVIPGYPEATASELEWLAAKWGSAHFKQMFDEIFLDYGRKLKPDLTVAQWDHLGQVAANEERAFLPPELWGRGEDYFWYSGGAAFVGESLNLKERRAGDAWLSLLYVRELADGKPFVMGKYEPVRMAVTMAEGFATGGMGMGRYAKFEDPVGFEVLTRYMQFMHRHRDLYDGAARYADAALILPRQSVLSRQPASLDQFRTLGQALVERQVLLDVVADERLTPARLKNYPAVILPRVSVLSDSQVAMLREYQSAGGRLLRVGPLADRDTRGEPRPTEKLVEVESFDGDAASVADAIHARLRAAGASVVTAPWTVRAAAYTQPHRVLLHLVNYDRDESPVPRASNGPAAERPLAVEKISVDLRLPAGRTVARVQWHHPEGDAPVELPYTAHAGRVSVEIPRALVYGIVAVETK